MSDYVQKVLREIKSRRDARLIGAELNDHIAEKQALFCERGYDPAAAAQMADAAMGEEAQTVGAGLSALHRRSRAWDIALSALYLAVLVLLKDIGYILTLVNSEWYLKPRSVFSLPEFVFYVLIPMLIALSAYRRRLVLPPLFAGFLVLRSSSFSLFVPIFWAELCTGGLMRALAENKVYTLLSASSAVGRGHTAAMLGFGILAAVLSLLSLRRRTARTGKRDKSIGRTMACVMSAVLLLQGAAGAGTLLLSARAEPEAYGLPAYPAAEDFALVFGDEEPVCEQYRDGNTDRIAFLCIPGDSPSLRVADANVSYAVCCPEDAYKQYADQTLPKDSLWRFDTAYGAVDRFLTRKEPVRYAVFTEYRPRVLVLGEYEGTVWQQSLEWRPDESLTVLFRMNGNGACELVLLPDTWADKSFSQIAEAIGLLVGG